MLRIHRVWCAVLAGSMALGIGLTQAQDSPQAAPKAAAPAAAPAAAKAAAEEPVAPPGVRGEAYRNLDAPAGKLILLAEAIPADKYTWRPAEGVRSVSEVLLHVSALAVSAEAGPGGAS